MQIFYSVTPAYYRDLSYPGPDRNSVDCPAFLWGEPRRAGRGIYPAAAFHFVRNSICIRAPLHLQRRLRITVATRTGRFFWTNGVEYSAWPIAASFSKKIVHIDLPLVIVGRTGKSWGSNIALCNPGKERIQEFINDVDHERKHAPLNNFTMCNLMAEGMLTAKSLFPKEFEAYEFDEVRYLRRSMAELRKRQDLGVDVSKEIKDAIAYAAKYPGLVEEFEAPAKAVVKNTLKGRIRSKIGDLGARTVRERIAAYQLAQKLEQGGARSGFKAFGKDFSFSDILGCVEFLGRYLVTTPEKAFYDATSYSSCETSSER